MKRMVILAFCALPTAAPAQTSTQDCMPGFDCPSDIASAPTYGPKVVPIPVQNCPDNANGDPSCGVATLPPAGAGAPVPQPDLKTTLFRVNLNNQFAAMLEAGTAVSCGMRGDDWGKLLIDNANNTAAALAKHFWPRTDQELSPTGSTQLEVAKKALMDQYDFGKNRKFDAQDCRGLADSGVMLSLDYVAQRVAQDRHVAP